MKTEKPIQKPASAKSVVAKSSQVSKKIEEQPEVKVEVSEPVIKEIETFAPQFDEVTEKDFKNVEAALEYLNNNPVVVEGQPEVQLEVVEETETFAPQIYDDPERFNLEIKDIARVIRRSPLITEVLLVSGDTVQINTEDFEKLRNPEDPTSIIQFL